MQDKYKTVDYSVQIYVQSIYTLNDDVEALEKLILPSCSIVKSAPAYAPTSPGIAQFPAILSQVDLTIYGGRNPEGNVHTLLSVEAVRFFKFINPKI